MNHHNSNFDDSVTTLMQSIRIHSQQWYFNQNEQYFVIIETYKQQSNQLIQSVTRNLTEINSLSNYITTQYGGYIVPVIQSIGELQNDIQSISDKIEQYLQDVRQNQHTGKDRKFYYFIFQQEMIFPHQRTYQRVLINASNMSKKYLNIIFTRKQQPREKQKLYLLNIHQKIQQKFSYYHSIKNLTKNAIQQERCLEQIQSIFSEMSRSLCKSAHLQQNKMIEAEKILQVTDGYLLQTREAFTRWQILTERVRELQNNVFKGLHSDTIPFQTKSNQLKNWTQTLTKQFLSMSNYFDIILDSLCNFISDLKTETINCDLVSFEKTLLDQLNQQNKQMNCNIQSLLEVDQKKYQQQGKQIKDDYSQLNQHHSENCNEVLSNKQQESEKNVFHQQKIQ